MSAALDTVIGQTISTRRRELGLTQGALAIRAACARGTINRLENGHLPKVATLIPIGRALGLSAAELLGGGVPVTPFPLSTERPAGYDGPTVGSSDVAAILNLSPWSSPGETWAKMTGLVERYGGGNASTLRGHIIEPALLNYWGETHGVEAIAGPPTPSAPVIGSVPWMHCRPDGVAILNGERVLIEIKTTRSWQNWGIPEDGGEPPVYYLLQVLWQMAVCDAEQTSLIAYSPMDDGLRVYTIRRDRQAEAAVVAKVREWMDAHVWGDPRVPECAASLLHFPEAGPEMLDPSDDDMALIVNLHDVRQQMAALTDQKKALERSIQMAIGEARGFRGCATWANTKGRVTVDTKRLKAEFPEAYEACKREGKASRSFRNTYKPERLAT
ncbi:MAG: hypothetical protein DRQ55_20485 [Planctomycetota bacterium]|nr:MAG: hypothetical protein DRQ55_20485 [Planctomycetota bacterium]